MFPINPSRFLFFGNQFENLCDNELLIKYSIKCGKLSVDISTESRVRIPEPAFYEVLFESVV